MNIGKHLGCAVVALFGSVLAGTARADPSGGLVPALTGIGWTNGWVEAWHSSVPGLVVADTQVRESPNRVRIVRRWTYQGSRPLEKVTLGVRYHVAGRPADLRPYVPGVLLYGNPSKAGCSDGRVPVYAGVPGEFAIFEEHRLPMPFVLLENAVTRDYAAVHVLPSPVRGAVREDLWWSAGVEAKDDGADIVLLSGPVGYNGRHSVVKALQKREMAYDETYLTLQPGQIVEKTFWIETGRSEEGTFGFQRVLRTSLDLFRPFDAGRFADMDTIVRTKRKYALTRWMERDNGTVCGFDMYDKHVPQQHIVLGWCGCAATCGYALPVLDVDPADAELARRSLDFIAERLLQNPEREDGLFPAIIDFKTLETSGGDPVSCGQGLYSILKAIRFARRSGRSEGTDGKLRLFAERAAERIARAILSPGWKDPQTTGSGFLIAPLVLASELFSRPECLAAARRMADVYERLHFGYQGLYRGGALDSAACEDKEGAFAAFQGYSALLWHAVRVKDSEFEQRYARLARHAMDVVLTYVMVWDATYPPGRLSDHAFKSTGWTVVSVQNQHLDAFGVLMTPELWRMGDYLKDDRLKELARVMYRSCFQLTDASGSQGEQVQHTNFAQRGDMGDVYRMRGGYSEKWTVFWLTAHFLNAAAEFKEMGVRL